MKFVGLAVYFEEHDTIAVSDLQLGQEEELRSKGHFVLDRELQEMKKDLRRLIVKTGAKRLVINGDIKHEFSRISSQEWSAVLDLLDVFSDVEIVFVKGNHDNMLEPILKKCDVALHDEYLLGDILFIHGHELPKTKEFSTLVIGHEHPAVRFSDGVRSETVKCFLRGSWQGKELIVLPSFTKMSVGTDVLKSSGLGPFAQNKDDFEVFVCLDEAVVSFGKIKDIKRITQD